VTPWQVLGIPAASSRADAERAYRLRMKRSHPDAGGSTAEAIALNQAIAWVRTHPRAAPSTGIPNPSTGIPRPPAAPAKRPPAWQTPAPAAASSSPGPRESRGWPTWPTWLAAIAAALIGLVLIIACWQAILLAVATLLAMAIVVSALTE